MSVFINEEAVCSSQSIQYRTKKKYLTKYSNKYESEYPWVRPSSKGETYAYCKSCGIDICIASVGSKGLRHHEITNRHISRNDASMQPFQTEEGIHCNIRKIHENFDKIQQERKSKIHASQKLQGIASHSCSLTGLTISNVNISSSPTKHDVCIENNNVTKGYSHISLQNTIGSQDVLPQMGHIPPTVVTSTSSNTLFTNTYVPTITDTNISSTPPLNVSVSLMNIAPSYTNTQPSVSNITLISTVRNSVSSLPDPVPTQMIPLSNLITPVSSEISTISSDVVPVSIPIVPILSSLVPVSSEMVKVLSTIAPVSSEAASVSSCTVPISSIISPASCITVLGSVNTPPDSKHDIPVVSLAAPVITTSITNSIATTSVSSLSGNCLHNLYLSYNSNRTQINSIPCFSSKCGNAITNNSKVCSTYVLLPQNTLNQHKHFTLVPIEITNAFKNTQLNTSSVRKRSYGSAYTSVNNESKMSAIVLNHKNVSSSNDGISTHSEKFCKESHVPIPQQQRQEQHIEIQENIRKGKLLYSCPIHHHPSATHKVCAIDVGLAKESNAINCADISNIPNDILNNYISLVDSTNNIMTSSINDVIKNNNIYTTAAINSINSEVNIEKDCSLENGKKVFSEIKHKDCDSEDGEEDMKCTFCGVEFEKWSKLKKHLVKHVVDAREEIACNKSTVNPDHTSNSPKDHEKLLKISVASNTSSLHSDSSVNMQSSFKEKLAMIDRSSAAIGCVIDCKCSHLTVDQQKTVNNREQNLCNIKENVNTIATNNNVGGNTVHNEARVVEAPSKRNTSRGIRKRGRQPLSRNVTSESRQRTPDDKQYPTSFNSATNDVRVKRKRGRPRKNPNPEHIHKCISMEHELILSSECKDSTHISDNIESDGEHVDDPDILQNNKLPTEQDDEPSQLLQCVTPSSSSPNDTKLLLKTSNTLSILTDSTTFLTSTSVADVASKRNSLQDNQIPILKHELKTTPIAKASTASGVKKNKRSLQCRVCRKILASREALREHQALVHNNGRPYTCEICKRCFSSQHNLTTHTHHRHGPAPASNASSGTTALTCALCPTTCSTRANLRAHTALHTGLRPFSCTLCPASFTRKGTLVSHLRYHRGERRYTCELCGLTFFTAHTLRRHAKLHADEREHACDVCGARYVTLSDLKRHSASHATVKPHACTLCSKTFARRHDLKIHLRYHKKDAQYTCSQCNKQFVEQSNYRRHLRRHTGEKPYACTVCGMLFPQLHHVKKHQQSSHTTEEVATASATSQGFSGNILRHCQKRTGRLEKSTAGAGSCDTASGNSEGNETYLNISNGQNTSSLNTNVTRSLPKNCGVNCSYLGTNNSGDNYCSTNNDACNLNINNVENSYVNRNIGEGGHDYAISIDHTVVCSAGRASQNCVVSNVESNYLSSVVVTPDNRNFTAALNSGCLVQIVPYCNREQITGSSSNVAPNVNIAFVDPQNNHKVSQNNLQGITTHQPNEHKHITDEHDQPMAISTNTPIVKSQYNSEHNSYTSSNNLPTITKYNVSNDKVINHTDCGENTSSSNNNSHNNNLRSFVDTANSLLAVSDPQVSVTDGSTITDGSIIYPSYPLGECIN